MDKKLYLRLLKARRQLKRVELASCYSLINYYTEKVSRLKKRLGLNNKGYIEVGHILGLLYFGAILAVILAVAIIF